MSKQLVTLISVEVDVPVQKKDGGTYQATKLIYTDSSGRTTTKPIATAALGHESNVALAMKINNLSQGTFPKEVVLTTVKNGNFENVTDIQSPSEVDGAELTQKASGSSTGKTSSYTTTSGGQSKTGWKPNNKSPEERKSIQAQVALKAAVELAVGTGNGNVSEIANNAKTFNKLLSELVGE